MQVVCLLCLNLHLMCHKILILQDQCEEPVPAPRPGEVQGGGGQEGGGEEAGGGHQGQRGLATGEDGLPSGIQRRLVRSSVVDPDPEIIFLDPHPPVITVTGKWSNSSLIIYLSS